MMLRVREHRFARKRIWFNDRRMNAGTIGRVPFLEYAAPSPGLLDPAKVCTDFNMIGVQLRVFDCEFSHIRQTSFGSVRLFCKPVMLADDVALLVQRWRGLQRLAGRERARF